MDATEPTPSLITGIVQRRGLRQFIKFCTVGASSTAIYVLIYWLLIDIAQFDRIFGSLPLARPPAQVIAFICSVTNGFFWNNRWTFRKGEETGGQVRYAKFVGTNVIGLLLNLSIVSLVANLLPRPTVELVGRYLPSKDPAGFVGVAVATFVVVFWNFTASKYWTFKN